jgi:hypothetical protein
MSQSQTLPSVSQLNARLAQNASRVRQFADNLIEQTDQLVEASIQEDWTEVGRLSEYIARGSEMFGNPDVAKQAWNVIHQLQQPENVTGVRRGIVRLLGACGRTSFVESEN